jgi:hypothetical protein
MGSIRGFVKDAEGNPLAGAAVVVLANAEEASAEKVVKRASTDKDGKFIAAGIIPGRYRIKAEADGFSPVELAANVLANKATIFDSIRLRQVNVLSDQTRVNADPKYSARSARGSVLHFEETKRPPTEAADPTVVLSPRATDLHGVVQAFGESTLGGTAGPGSYVGANFAISQTIARDADVIVSGQVGAGNGAPQRLEVLTTYHADRHQLSVALGYARFTFSRNASQPRLGQFSLSARDMWQVSGPIVVVYGLEFARFTEGAAGTSVLPRLGFAVDAAPKTKLFAGIEPGSSIDEQSRVELESGEIILSEPRPVAIGPTGEPIQDRSYRLQVGGEHVLSDKSSVEVMAFLDTVAGHGVGLLAIPIERGGFERAVRSAEQKGRSRGVRVVYHRRVNKVLDGAVGYAFGEGQQLDSGGITEPANLFDSELFHVFAAQVNLNFVSTGTRVSTVLRLAPRNAVFAIDPFQGQLTTYDPNVSVSFSQALPVSGFMPGHWEALIDLRNLLAQQSSVADETQELIATRFNRLVRVGLSFRF